MAQYKLAFLGTGNMGGALVAAAANGGHGAACILSNRTPQKARALAQKYGCAVAASNSEAAGRAQYILLGVKPQMMAGLLAEIAPCCAGGRQRATPSALSAWRRAFRWRALPK